MSDTTIAAKALRDAADAAEQEVCDREGTDWPTQYRNFFVSTDWLRKRADKLVAGTEDKAG